MTGKFEDITPKESAFRFWLRRWMNYNGYTPEGLKENYWILLAFVQWLESVEAAKPPDEQTWADIDR